MVTPKKPLPPIPSNEDLVRDFTGQAFRDLIVANTPPGTNVEVFSKGALASAKAFARDADKPRRLTTTARPLQTPRREAAHDFTIGLQITYAAATGEMPSLTASQRDPGPFARILGQCLRWLNAPSFDAVELINSLQRRARRMAIEKGRKPRGTSGRGRKKKPPARGT